MSMQKLIDETHAKLMQVSSARDWEQSKIDERTERLGRIGSHSGLANSETGPVVGSGVQSIAEDTAVDEDQNRSDSETALFFTDMALARSVMRLALSLGLVEGEVTFDNSVDPSYGLGKYAVRISPSVKWMKPKVYYDLIHTVHDMVGPDVDGFAEHMEWAGNVLSEKFNPVHGKDGKFSDKSTVSGGGGGSKVDPNLKKKRFWKGKNWKIRNKICGRAARKPGVAQSKKYVRCWDGKVPEWAQKKEWTEGSDSLNKVEYIISQVERFR